MQNHGNNGHTEGKKRAALHQKDFFRLCTWIQSQSKDGKIEGGLADLAFKASQALAVQVSNSSIRSAADAASIEIIFRRNTQTPSQRDPNRAIATCLVLRQLVDALEAKLGEKFLNEDERRVLRAICLNRGGCDIPVDAFNRIRGMA